MQNFLQKNDQIDFEDEYSKLNLAQKEAVDSIYWPVMVVAWPGTGKTQIIALRTANIILKTWVNPENILITTFTDAGVIAIKKRLVKFLGTTWYKVSVSTIHSFAQDVIKTFPEKFVEFKLSILIDEVEGLEILKKIIDRLIETDQVEVLTNDFDRYLYLRDIKDRITKLKQEWINKIKFSEIIEKQKQDYVEELLEIKPTLKKYETTKEKQENHIKKLEELNIFFEEYNAYLRENSLYDFNDMINFVLERFETDKDLRLFYAETFQFIMLDEYQDTNNAQNRIIELILNPQLNSLSQEDWISLEEQPNILVVWDDDQSIYRFQWANIENMLDFSNKYKDTKIIVLEENYRSNKQILNLSSILINNNEERLSKKISSINKKLIASGSLKDSINIPTLFRANSETEEQAFVVNNIKNLINSWEDKEEIAIIVRNNKEVEILSELLQKNKIDVESKLKTNILNSPYVNYILNYLEIINNPYANEKKLLDIMRAEITGLKSIDILNINRYLYQKNYALKFKLKLADVFKYERILEEVQLTDKELLQNFFEKILKFNKELVSKSISEFFAGFITNTWIIEYVETYWDFADLEDIYTLFNKIKEWNNNDKILNIEKLLWKIELYKTYNYSIPRQILTEKRWWVQILTAHSSKWLEYNNVFVTWLYAWNWDWKRVIDKLKLPSWIIGDWIQNIKDSQIEEERRLFFVAITRAKDKLFLSYSIWAWTKVFLESQFVGEINWFYKEEQNLKLEKIQELVEKSLKNSLIKYTELELEYIKNFLETYKLSASDLNTFIEDPLQFLHKVVFRYPFEDNKYTIFWKVYHRTLELFYLKYKNEQKLPEKSYLVGTFKLLIEKEVLTPEECENALNKGVKWLEWYYDEYSKKADIPLFLEYSFRNKNLIFENIPLTWTIDKIEKIGEVSTLSFSGLTRESFGETKQLINNSEFVLQSNFDNKKILGSKPENDTFPSQLAFFKDSVSLVDYKTWNIKSLWQIKWIDRYWNKKEWGEEWKYFRQLLFYKLLCEVDFEFSSKFDVWSIAIDFVEWKDGEYKLVQVEFSDEEYEDFKNIVREVWEKINDLKFWKDLFNEPLKDCVEDIIKANEVNLDEEELNKIIECNKWKQEDKE